MTRGRDPAPTRYNLLRSRRRLDRVRRGSDLLRRKRQSLVGELFRLAGAAIDARHQAEERAGTLWPAALRALAAEGGDGASAVGWPVREATVEIRPERTWGIGVAEIVERTAIARGMPARGTAPPLTGPATAAAAEEAEALIELLLDAASREMLIRRLGAALSRTSRQLHTLEQRVSPDLEGQIARTRRVLEEREREEHGRVRHLMRARRRPEPEPGAVRT